jgi:Ca2+-binding EF-hand superfamily protein
LMSSMDKDKNGKVNWPEFKKFMRRA